MFHPNTISGYHPKVQVEIPFYELPVSTKSIVDKVKNAVRFVFEVIGEIFLTLYRSLRGMYEAPTNEPGKGFYKVSYNYSNLKADKKPYIIWSVDGGGVRGVATLAAMKIVEKMIGTNLSKAVNCFAGTSTGGIITAALSVPKADNPNEPRFTAKEVDNLYNELAKDIFSQSFLRKIRSGCGLIDSKYASPKPVVEGIIGDVPLSQSVAESNVITSVDLITSKLFLFGKNMQVDSEYLKDKKVDFIQAEEHASFLDATLATSAAPTYFPTRDFQGHNLVDGGLIANNPAEVATLLAMAKVPKDRPILVISMGTGKLPHESITNAQPKNWGIFQWIKPLINTLLDSSQYQVDRQMEMLCQADPRVSYVRFQFLLENATQEAMDNASPKNMASLRQLGKKCFKHFLANGGEHSVIEPLRQNLRA